MTRRASPVALLLALLIGLVGAGPASAATAPLPASMAAVGDSITQAASSGGSLGADYPANSWSTGTSSSVNSHYLRLIGAGAPISGEAYNASVSGAKAVDLNAQMQSVVGLQPDYVTVLIGGNDLCTDTVAAMTSVTDFRAHLSTAMATLAAGSPDTYVYVVSIPDIYQLWNLFKGNWRARLVWSAADICQSLLANPTSTQQTDVQRRAAVRQRNIDFNAVLADVCAAHARCHFDGNAVFNTAFTTSDVSGDYFHPSVSGQAKLAAVSWGAGFSWSTTPPPTQAMWVSELRATSTASKGSWTATATIVVDSGAGAVEGATVTGTWNATSGSCTTDASGTCSVSASFNKKTPSATFTVTGVAKPGWTWDDTLGPLATTVDKP